MGHAVGVNVGVNVRVEVGISVGVRLGRFVAVAAGVSVTVDVCVGQSVAVSWTVAVELGVGDVRVLVAAPAVSANDGAVAEKATAGSLTTSVVVGTQADKITTRTSKRKKKNRFTMREL